LNVIEWWKIKYLRVILASLGGFFGSSGTLGGGGLLASAAGGRGFLAGLLGESPAVLDLFIFPIPKNFF
jgi:hypothetical protein